MRDKKPTPVFELVFTGGGIYPEKIPLSKVADALSAIKRLAAGELVGAEDEEEEDLDGPVRLLDVTRSSSAVFRFVGPSITNSIQRLREIGRVLENPEDVGEENEYIIRPIKDLSSIADSLDCSLLLREAKKGHEIFARIEKDSYSKVASSILVSGSTKISGTVQGVGGATSMRCRLRVAFQKRLLFCRLENPEVARQLGESLYKQVIAFGNARWLRNSMRMFSFTIQEITKPKNGSISEHLDALWEAGLQDWENVANPDAYLQEIRGDE
jgi:hypothetical protein